MSMKTTLNLDRVVDAAIDEAVKQLEPAREAGALTLQQALFWLNLYRDLLAVDENALQRMRALLLEEPARGRGEADYLVDVELVMSEIERVRARHNHWLAVVDRMKLSPLSPIVSEALGLD